MFERDHGPLGYQLAYAPALGTSPALPRHRDLSMRAALLHEHGGPPDSASTRPEPARGRDTRPRSARRPSARWTCCAPAGRRTSARRHCPTSLACRASESSGPGQPVSPPGSGCGSRRRPGCGRRRQPGQRCTMPDADIVPIPRRCRRHRSSPPLGLSGGRRVDGADLAGRLQTGRAVIVLGAGGAVGQVALAAAEASGRGQRGRVCRSADFGGAGAGGPERPMSWCWTRTRSAPARGRPTAARLTEAAGGPVDVVIDPVFGEPAAAAAMCPRTCAAGWSTSAGRPATRRVLLRRAPRPHRRTCSATRTTRSPRSSGPRP